MKKRIIGIIVCVIMVLSLLVVLAPAQIAIAMVGPTNTLPGGVTIGDNDTGNGEQWGRIGGRTFIFSGIDTSLFTELYWGPAEVLNSEVVKMAFDGAYGDPGETLTYQALSSNPLMGVLVWEGSTHVTLQGTCSGIYNVPTRFTLTIKDGLGVPISLATPGGMSLPKVDVLTLTPELGVYFYATLQMEAVNPVNCYVAGCPTPHTLQGQLGPALDVYDCLNTAPPPEKALTYFNYGFYYEAVGGATLDQVAAAVEMIEGKADTLQTEVGYIYADWDGVRDALLASHGVIEDGIVLLESKMDTQGGKLDQIMSNTSNLGDLGEVPNDLANMSGVIDEILERAEAIGGLPNLELLLLLFGIEMDEIPQPPPPGYPTLEDIIAISDLYQALIALEAKADALEVKVDNLDVSEINADIAALEAKMDSLEIKMDYVIQLLEDLPFQNAQGPKDK